MYIKHCFNIIKHWCEKKYCQCKRDLCYFILQNWGDLDQNKNYEIPSQVYLYKKTKSIALSWWCSFEMVILYPYHK